MKKKTIFMIVTLMLFHVGSNALDNGLLDDRTSTLYSDLELLANFLEIGSSEIDLLSPVNSTNKPVPVYHLSSSRMFTILYLKLNATGETTLDESQIKGQPTLIVDGTVFPIRNRYGDFNVYLTLTQGFHILSFMNLGISGNVGDYQLVHSQKTISVYVGSTPEIPTFAEFQINFNVSLKFNSSKTFASDEVPIDSAIFPPKIINGTVDVFTSNLKTTGFVGNRDIVGSYPATSGWLFLQSYNGIRQISNHGNEPTMGFKDSAPFMSFVSIYPIGYGTSESMTYFDADSIVFEGTTTLHSTNEPTPTKPTTTQSSEPENSSTLSLRLSIMWMTVVSPILLVFWRKKK